MGEEAVFAAMGGCLTVGLSLSEPSLGAFMLLENKKNYFQDMNNVH